MSVHEGIIDTTLVGLERLLRGTPPLAMTAGVSSAAMAAEGVEVATEQVVRAWHRSETRDLWLEYTPAKGWPGQLDAVNSAVWAANMAFDEADETGYFASADGPWEEPLKGVAQQILLNRCESEAALRHWLAAFAGSMAAAGAVGVLNPQRRPDYPSLEVENTMPWPQLTAFVAYDMEGPVVEPHRWNVAPEATARIAALDERNVFPGAESYICSLGTRRAAPAAVVAALERLLLRKGIVTTSHLRPDPPRVVQSGFLGNGHAARLVYDPSLPWRDRLEDQIAFVTALAELTTVAFVQYATGAAYGMDSMEYGFPPLPEGLHEYHFRGWPERLLQHVPDARGVVVLTDAHLDRANDLSAWTVTSLGAGRHLVLAAALADWFAQPDVDAEVLAAARADFGDMLFRLAPEPA